MSNFTFEQMSDTKPAVGGGGKVHPDSGDYVVSVASSKYNSNKNGKGSHYAIDYTILDGPFSGITVTKYYNVENPNEVAQNISRGEMMAIQVVTGFSGNDPAQLVGETLKLRLIKSPTTFTNKEGNLVNTFETKVVMYMTVDGNDAEGNQVPDFVDRSPPQPLNNSGAGAGSSNASANIDDNIPF